MNPEDSLSCLMDEMQLAIVRSWLQQSKYRWEEESYGFKVFIDYKNWTCVRAWSDFQRLKGNSMITINRIR